MSTHAAQMPGKSGQTSSEAATAPEAAQTPKAFRSAADAQKIPAWATALGPAFMLQAKLTVNQPGDPYEQEADRVAEQVMRLPAAPAGVLRRCACGGSAGPDGECEACRQKRLTLQRQVASPSPPRSSSSASSETSAPSSVHDVLQTHGQPLDENARSFMETRFGYDFSQVRIHTDSRATEAAQMVHAHAFTVGQDIVFNAGQYTPTTREGQHLLAHELTHVVQQNPRSPSAEAPSQIRRSGEQGEQEADRTAPHVMHGSSVPIAASVQLSGFLQRASSTESQCHDIAGSVADYRESKREEESKKLAKRKNIPPVVSLSQGHGGRALQMEMFLEREDPDLLERIHGIFINQDMAKGSVGQARLCKDLEPPIKGAPEGAYCVFVHGETNQEAFLYNTTDKTTGSEIGGRDREEWRLYMLEMLTHEVQHTLYSRGAPEVKETGGSCTPSDVKPELSELSSLLSEFPVYFKPLQQRGLPVHEMKRHSRPEQTLMLEWLNKEITGDGSNASGKRGTKHGEYLQGIVQRLRCLCDKHGDDLIKQSFDFVTSSWTEAEKNALNVELGDPKWGLNWPLHAHISVIPQEAPPGPGQPPGTTTAEEARENEARRKALQQRVIEDMRKVMTITKARIKVTPELIVTIEPRLAKPYITRDAFEKKGIKYRDPKQFEKGEPFVKQAGDTEPIGPDDPSQGKIRYSDVSQGFLNDCYLFAAMAALAKSRPEYISQLIHPNGDGTYDVTLYIQNERWQPQVTPTIVKRIRPIFPTYRSGRAAFGEPVRGKSDEGKQPQEPYELWPMLIEKAYAYVRGGYDIVDVQGGQSTAAAFSMLVKGADSIQHDIDTKPESEEAIAQTMDDARKNNQPVTAGTKSSFKGVSKKLLKKYGFEKKEDHYFVILAVNTDKKTIDLYNPWGEPPIKDFPLSVFTKFFDVYFITKLPPKESPSSP